MRLRHTPAFLLALASLGCQRSEGPAPSAVTTETAPPGAAPTVKAPPPGKPVPIQAEAGASPSDAGQPDAVSKPPVTPALVDDGGAPLPQTKARPGVDSAFFKHLKHTLFAAIQQDDPGIARELFFPVEGYRLVKAIGNPDRDYKRRLLKAYERDIHDYHKRLGDHPEAAELIDLEVPDKRARWMKPGSEGNKLGYFRVLRSQMRFRDAKGKERSLEITSLISWRGEWYVVHIHGFK